MGETTLITAFRGPQKEIRHMKSFWVLSMIFGGINKHVQQHNFQHMCLLKYRESTICGYQMIGLFGSIYKICKCQNQAWGLWRHTAPARR